MDTNTEFLGQYGGRFYVLTRKVDPSFQNIDRFSVSLHFTHPETGGEIEVVRIDNAHGYVHIHRLYEGGAPEQPMPELDAFSAYDYLKENWNEFARKYG